VRLNTAELVSASIIGIIVQRQLPILEGDMPFGSPKRPLQFGLSKI